MGDTSLQIQKFAAHTFVRTQILKQTPVWLFQDAILLHTLVFVTLEVFGHFRKCFVQSEVVAAVGVFNAADTRKSRHQVLSGQMVVIFQT